MRVTGTSDTAAELREGITRGESPQPELDTAGGEALTRLSSWWNHLRCTSCGHTFRRGDRVLVDSRERTVAHLVSGLACGAQPDPGIPAGPADEVAAFRDGLMSAWPVPAGTRLRTISADDWRIPKGPADVRDANVCLHCGHTFRAGECVVVCPCRPERLPHDDEDGPPRPAVCGRAVHRDPAAGLPCWESWRPDGEVTVCPVTQTGVPRP